MKTWVISSMAVLMCFATLSVVEGVTCPDKAADGGINECNTRSPGPAACVTEVICAGSGGVCSGYVTTSTYWGKFVCVFTIETYVCESTTAALCYTKYACQNAPLGGCETDWFNALCSGNKTGTSTNRDAEWCECG